MSYNLNINQEQVPTKQESVVSSFRRLLLLMGNERTNLYFALVFIFINSSLNLVAPYIVGHTVDSYIVTRQYDGVIRFSIILLVVFVFALISGYTQTQVMGRVGQRMLYNLRNKIFNKLQELPIDFFNQNKAGDLISRVNNDTDKINQFFSQSLVQFMSNIFTLIGAGVFLFTINVELTLAALTPALLLVIFASSISSWVKRRNANSLKSTGYISSEIQESLNNFKVIIAFNRRDYFRKRFDAVNTENFGTAVKAGIANNMFLPVFSFSSSIGQLIVLAFGIYLISAGSLTLGLLISFLGYITQFYNPLRQLSILWPNFQIALAGWDRISQILAMENNLTILPHTNQTIENKSLLSFQNVTFAYTAGTDVLKNVSFDLQRGKTYAFVGPTGGGKTTTASLMARLYDPTEGSVMLDGIDIRSVNTSSRSAKIGFILQDPFLFSGTIRDNILYGNACFAELSDDELLEELKEVRLEGLLQKFEGGLLAPIQNGGEGISQGQKQIIAFMRAVIRRPDLLILDEATANIDTVTEQLLDDILKKMPKMATKIIIAHRLNTIENADEIYFVNTGTIIKAGSMQEAVDLLMNDKRAS